MPQNDVSFFGDPWEGLKTVGMEDARPREREEAVAALHFKNQFKKLTASSSVVAAYDMKEL